MRAQVVVARDPFHPARGRQMAIVRRRRRVRALAPRTDRPFIALLNGQPLLRGGWNRRLADGDHLAFVLLPLGGGDGSSNPIATVAMIAVMVYAGPIAAGLGEAMGISSTLGLAALKLGVGLVGSMLVNALIPPPKAPSSQQAAALAAPSPTYDLAVQGNNARLKSPIPVQYGRLRFPPDFAANPYAEYAGNEQYLYQLFCLGQGSYDVEAITIEDTPIASFPEITYELVPPGGRVTLFPANVASSVEVSGQEATYNVALGPFVANAAGTKVNAIAIDVVASHGLYYANDSGALDAKTITWSVEARSIDDSGLPLGAWFGLGNESLTAATNTPQRMSYRYNVLEGRYQVRLTRTNAKDTSSRAGHELDWVGLRGYLPGDQVYGNVTMLAMRMKASNSLSAQASRKVFVLGTRKVKTWNPATGWSAETASRSIAWAAADAAMNDEYGAGLDVARLDVAQLYALDQVWTARGDHFDGRFDNALTFWEAASQIVKAGRAKPYLQGGILHVVRDGPQTLPVALFNMRNIVRGSFSVDYSVTTSETADAIDGTYFDEVVWAPRPVRAYLPGSAQQQVADLDMFGVINRNHCWRECTYQLASTKYRPRTIKWATEMEGFIPAFGDLVAVSHDMPKWGQGGEVVAWTPGTRTLKVSEPMTFTAGQTHYIGLARRNGSVDGPIAATAGADAYTLVLAADPDFTPYAGSDEERTKFAFGPGSAWAMLAVVTAVRPKSLTRVEIEAVNYDARVHTADQTGGPAAAPVSNLPAVATVPTIGGVLAVVVGGTLEAPTLSASWTPAPGATGYLVEHSFDGVLWTRKGDITAANFSMVTTPGDQYLRVAPVGTGTGAWKTWNGTVAGAVNVQPGVAPTNLVATASANSIFLTWDAYTYAGNDHMEVLRNTSNNSDLAKVIDTVRGPVALYGDYLGDSGLTRYYWLRPVNSKGVAGSLSNVASATTGAISATPPAGSIVHSMMAADAIWAVNLKAGEVQTNHLSANIITAGSGKIANLAVDTLQIANQAVTVPVFVQDSSTSTIPGSSTSGGETSDLLSAATTSSGAPIKVDVNFVLGLAISWPFMQFRLYRDGSLIQSVGPLTGCYLTSGGGGVYGTFPLVFSFVDQPTGGSHTYSIRIYFPGIHSSTISLYSKSIALMEVKK